jgi:hypothetical protein
VGLDDDGVLSVQAVQHLAHLGEVCHGQRAHLDAGAMGRGEHSGGDGKRKSDGEGRE